MKMIVVWRSLRALGTGLLVRLLSLDTHAAVDDLPLLDDASLSPDGTHVLSLRSNGEVYELAVRVAPDGEDRVIVPASRSPGLLNWCRWANNQRILCSWRFSYTVPRVGPVTATRLFAIDRDGSHFLQLDVPARNLVGRAPLYRPQIRDRIVPWLADDDRHILV
ncbi:MAG: hypothetical protein FJ194_02975 [Gammaproteobacteria bacterium]|nr:hypothetical protein [Gammaproteobacteria bacterium]